MLPVVISDFSGFFAPIHSNFGGIELARPVVKNELVNRVLDRIGGLVSGDVQNGVQNGVAHPRISGFAKARISATLGHANF